MLNQNIASFELGIDGLGIIMYSPSAAAHIAQGEHYLDRRFSDNRHIVDHLAHGRLIGFETGSPGDFNITVWRGAPPDGFDDAAATVLLALRVTEEELRFRDVYALLRWDPNRPPFKAVRVDDGAYLVTVRSWLPSSGIVGDHQTIDVWLEPKADLPEIVHDRIPTLHFPDHRT